MILSSRPLIVVLGMMSRTPVAGVVWQTMHYLIGFRRLGYDVLYVEAHGRTPGMLMESDRDDSSARAAAFIDRIMRRFDLGDQWAFHALHDDGRCFGLSEDALKRAYREAAVLINLHGGTEPQPEHAATGRLIYVETDPGALQVELLEDRSRTLEFLEPHVAVFTFAENYGHPDCALPMSNRFTFRPTRQPVVVDLWEPYGTGRSGRFTTVGNWRQHGRDIVLRDETYTWSKHHEFLRFIDLPDRTDQTMELALSNCDQATRDLLGRKGWRVRDALRMSRDVDTYRSYIGGSRAEFTVAKDQNVRLRSGWFSDRSATYLAAGRPVVTQDTGFTSLLPTGQGLHAFTTMDEILAGIEDITRDYAGNSSAALQIAREHFSAEAVLTRLLAEVGQTPPNRRTHGSNVAHGPERGGSMADRIRSLLHEHLPEGASILVISGGAGELADLNGHVASHFPQAESGAHASVVPVDSDVAIAHLESLRLRGARYLLVPPTSFWWLEHYGAFRDHLQSHYRLVLDEPDVCLLYALEPEAAPGAPIIVGEISPLDREYQAAPRQYVRLGQRAIAGLQRAFRTAHRGDPTSILVFPSGHGRALRAIRAAYPDARITAWDVDPDAVAFCARVFGAIPVHGNREPAANRLDESFDLIWCGSLLSRVDAADWRGFLQLLSSSLSTDGVLVFTTRGRRVEHLMARRERTLGLTHREIRTLLETYRQDGISHVDGGPDGQGVTLASPEWVCSQLGRLPDLRLVAFTEGGYGDEDVVACIRSPIAASEDRGGEPTIPARHAGVPS